MQNLTPHYSLQRFKNNSIIYILSFCMFLQSINLNFLNVNCNNEVPWFTLSYIISELTSVTNFIDKAITEMLEERNELLREDIEISTDAITSISPVIIENIQEETIEKNIQPVINEITITTTETLINENINKGNIINTTITQLIDDNFTYIKDIPLSYDLQLYTYNRCKELNLRYPLVLGIMWRESGFDPNARGYNTWNNTYDNGLMQINDCNKRWLKEQYGIDNLMDPYQSINAGTQILSMFSKYGEHNMLMAYQYGEAGMKQQIAKGVTTNKQIQIAYDKAEEFQNMINITNSTI